MVSAVCIARADTIKIVALGASNTAGKNAGGAPYPAVLEQLLRAKGYDVEVINAGVNGDTTAGMFGRLGSAVPEGTRLVVLQPAYLNDNKAGTRSETGALISQIKSELSARHIRVIVLPPLGRIAGDTHSDSEHFNSMGHARIAAYLLPQVMVALGKAR